jgi:hypothetical protein
VFNVYYIDQVADWIVKNRKSFNFVYWNMLHEIWYFSIASLPRTVKSVLALHLQTVDIPAEFKQEFARIVDFMNNGESTDGSDMLAAITQLDQRRNQSLRAVAPELADLIGYED